MRVRIGDYKSDVQTVYAIVKEKSGVYACVTQTNGSDEETAWLRDYAMCEIADWMKAKGATKAKAIGIFAGAVMGE